MYDAVELVAKALQTLDSSQPQKISFDSLDCKGSRTWMQGPFMLEALRKVSHLIRCPSSSMRLFQNVNSLMEGQKVMKLFFIDTFRRTHGIGGN
jgi:hypothetical protein